MAITNQDKKWRENMKRWKRGNCFISNCSDDDAGITDKCMGGTGGR